MTHSTPDLPAPQHERVRHELKRRRLTVAKIEQLTPVMLRLHLTGEELADFTSLSPDDHIKIFIPLSGGEPAMRDYTPRAFDRAARRLVIDFAVHEAGPATDWAVAAKVGGELNIGGPRGSLVLDPAIRNFLLIGDETALPAIGRRIEEASGDLTITSLVAVPSAADEQSFPSEAQVTSHWTHRPLSQASDPAFLLDLARKVTVPPGTFIWIAAEATVARALRNHFVEERGHPLSWTRASGYWQMGKADAHETIE